MVEELQPKKEKEGREITCLHCNHKWKYKGSSQFYCTCPNCHYLVNMEKS